MNQKQTTRINKLAGIFFSSELLLAGIAALLSLGRRDFIDIFVALNNVVGCLLIIALAVFLLVLLFNNEIRENVQAWINVKEEKDQTVSTIGVEQKENITTVRLGTHSRYDLMSALMWMRDKNADTVDLVIDSNSNQIHVCDASNK